MKKERVHKSDAEWKAELDPETYRITRHGGTEPPFSGALYGTKEAGKYHCACCGQLLFGSDTKYDSGSGWPSFWSPVEKEAVSERTDSSHNMARTEILCQRCDAHLGHVFPDGPEPTGLRYCVNSASLRFTPADDS